jgi:hypothetical protein
MIDQSNFRGAAVKAFHDRQALEQRRASNQVQLRQDQAQRWRQSFDVWRMTTAPMIGRAVNEVGNDYAREGSPFLFRPVPQAATEYAVLFKIRRSGELNSIAYLKFTMDADGRVVASTNALGVKHLPSSAPLNEVTDHWVQQVADDAMIAVLEGNWMDIRAAAS